MKKSQNMSIWVNQMVLVQENCAPAIKKCNKYDVTNAPYFLLNNHDIGLGGLLLIVSHLFAILVSWVDLGNPNNK